MTEKHAKVWVHADTHNNPEVHSLQTLAFEL